MVEHLLLSSLALRLVEDVRESTLAAVLTIVVGSHEDSSSTLLGRALAPQPIDLAIVVNLVVLELSKPDSLVLVADLLWGRVVLLLPLLRASSQPEHKMESGLLLNVVVGQSPAILQLFPSKDEPLLVWRDSLLVLYLRLHILNRVRRLNLQSDGLAREGLHEDLHASGSIAFFPLLL